MIKAIIVDDEVPQQELLAKRLCENFPDISLEAICSSVDEGVEKIELLKPQLVFLDVQMPPDTGFDLLKRLNEINFEVIVTTSFSEYAVEAFKVSAVYYLLKPYSVSDLQEAVEKFKAKMVMKQPYENIQTLLHNINVNAVEKTKIALSTQTGYIFITVSEIVRCQAEDNYTWFYFADKSRKLASKNLAAYEEVLAPFKFFRIHYSHLINMNRIKEYFKGKGEGGTVKMEDDCLIEVSRKRKAEFLNRLNKP